MSFCEVICSKDDFRKNYPLGMLAVSRKDVVRIHASSGTTGTRTVVGYTKNDIENWAQLVARIATAAGVALGIGADRLRSPAEPFSAWRRCRHLARRLWNRARGR